MKVKNRNLFSLILLLLSGFALFAQSPALIEKISIRNNRMDIKINAHFKKRFLTDDFFIEYDNSLNLSKLDQSILVMPFIMNVITAVWISGESYSIESLDKELYDSLIHLKKIFQYMYPKTTWNGDLIPQKLVKNSVPRGSNREALLFSGGLDSTSAALVHDEKRLLLISAWGQWDLPLNDQKLWKTITARLRNFAEKFGHENSFFKSNYAEFLNYDVLDGISGEISDWRIHTVEDLGWAGLTAPLLILKGCSTLRIASSATWNYRYPLAANPIIDATIKFAGITILQDQFDLSRLDKIEYIANIYKQKTEKLFLTVCQGQTDTNCCDCSKCLATIMGFIAFGENPRDWGFEISSKKAFKRTLQYAEHNELDYAFIERMHDIQEKLKEKSQQERSPLLNQFLSFPFDKKLKHTFQARNQTHIDWEIMKSLIPASSNNYRSMKKLTNFFVDKWQFAQFCDFAYDPESDPAMFPLSTKAGGVSFNPADVKAGDIIFLRARYTDDFFSKIVPHINSPFIIIAHGEYKDAFKSSYNKYLHDKKVIAWFGTHPCDSVHRKFHPIPLGVWANHREFGSAEEINSLFKNLQKKKKKKLVYGNFSLWTDPEREELSQIVTRKKLCKLKEPHLNFTDYLQEMSEYQFALSPRGLGIDCYRTWEALLVGTIPIVKHSHFDQLYKDLPVLIIDDWEELSHKFLEAKAQEINEKFYDLRPLYFSYWSNKIMTIRDQYLSSHTVELEAHQDQTVLQQIKNTLMRLLWY